MELVVFWSQFAEDKLKDIFDYYKVKAGLKTARKIIKEIIDLTYNLEKQPEIGPIEELLILRPEKFRYLVNTNYKIIYYINHESQRIVIANVFDVRQNPVKIIQTQSDFI